MIAEKRSLGVTETAGEIKDAYPVSVLYLATTQSCSDSDIGS